jgi:hypothetical protein
MGTYYALGVVKTFEVKDSKSLTTEQLQQAVEERLDLSLFELEFPNQSLKGTLKSGLFQENIEDFFNKLKAITTSRRSKIDFYFKEFSNDINAYPDEFCWFDFSDSQGNFIKIQADLVLLFLEGKVSAEEFELEPGIINWLFRHSRFDNPLAGAVISSIVG